MPIKNYVLARMLGWILRVPVCVFFIAGCAGSERQDGPAAPAHSPEPRDGESEILQSWQGDYPVAQLHLLPENQRGQGVGFIDDAESFPHIWKAFQPGEPVPQIDFKANLVLFARNTRFYNRIRIGKVKVTDGVAEVIAMETMSTMPIRDKVAMSMVVVPRKGIQFIRTPDETITISGQDGPRTYSYECAEGYSFTARTEATSVRLFLPEKTVELPRVPSASGVKYGAGQMMFWSKGEEALLEVGDERHANCANNRAKAIWEDAKLRGVDFRAVGNEPGWHLELTNGKKITFVGDYGNTRHVFHASEPSINPQERETVYKIQDPKHELTAVLRGKPCIDSMSGESFETTVTVMLDGKKYQGCGRPLH